MGTYGDLGKSARDVVGKGYHFSILKLDFKTKTATGVEFNSGGSSNTDSGKVTSSLETKYKCADYGMTFTEKWSTDNSLATTIELADKPLKGAKLVFDSTFSPQTGAKDGKIKTEYKQDMVTLTADMDLNLAGPTINASAVAGPLQRTKPALALAPNWLWTKTPLFVPRSTTALKLVLAISKSSVMELQ